MIWRILLALVAALAIMPVANQIAPDREAATTVQVPQELSTAIQAHIEDAARRYRVDKPEVRFVQSSVPGVTLKVLDDQGNRVQIRLGDQVREGLFSTHPEYVMAVVSHEFGHAAMMARNLEYPMWIILAMYAAGFFPFLVILPTLRSILAASLLLIGILTSVMLIPGIGLPHHAYLWMLAGICSAGVFAATLGRKKASHNPVITRLRPFLPAPLAVGIAAVASCLGFAFTQHVAGQMNTTRELRADVVGACLTSPQDMNQALLALRKNPDPATKESYDPFHPSMKARAELLEKLKDRGTIKAVCLSMESGQAPENLSSLLKL